MEVPKGQLNKLTLPVTVWTRDISDITAWKWPLFSFFFIITSVHYNNIIWIILDWPSFDGHMQLPSRAGASIIMAATRHTASPLEQS